MPVTHNLFVKQKGTVTSLKQPKEIGFYSRTSNDEFLINDNSMLRFYYLPDSYIEKNIDLCGGIKKFKDYYKNFEDAGTLKGLLSTVMHHEKTKNKKLKADIVSFRGVMKKLILSAFDSPNYIDINMRVVSFDGQLFIKEVKKKDPAVADTPIQPGEYSGYKFESISTLSKPLPFVDREVLEKRSKKIVSHGDEYITVVRTGVGKAKLLLGAEVDGIFDFEEEVKDNLKHYMELKCAVAVTTAADARRFEQKIFKTWIQCFLIGIPRIIYGFRDKNFTLKSVEEYTTDEVPILLKANNPSMASSCVDAVKWYGVFVDWLLSKIPKTEHKAYKLVYENNHLRLTEIEETDDEYDSLINGEAVLTKEFREWRTQLNQEQESLKNH